MDKGLGQRFADAAMLGLKRKIPGIPTEPFYCLKFVRRCVEYALKLPDRGFYSLVIGEDSNPSAYEIEQLLRKQRPKQIVSEVQPGDICFWPYEEKQKDGSVIRWGHTGIAVMYQGSLRIAQNTMVHSGIRYGGALALISLEAMGKPSTVVRLG